MRVLETSWHNMRIPTTLLKIFILRDASRMKLNQHQPLKRPPRRKKRSQKLTWTFLNATGREITNSWRKALKMMNKT